MFIESLDLIKQAYPAVLYIFIFLFGIVVGSFLNVCIFRLPKEESIVRVPSHCMSCGKKLHWYELIPLFSWLFLRGKCHGCKAKISPQYPVIEAANGLLWMLCFFMKGISPDFLLCCALFSALLVLSVIDARTQEIPNGINIFIAVVGAIRFGLSFYFNGFKWDTLLGPIIFTLLFFLIFLFSEGRAMGGGDIKLMFGIGLFLGAKLTLFGLVAACVVGSVIHLTLMAVKKVGRQLAFGPYLSIGFALSALVGNVVVDWYVSTFFSF